MVHPAVSKRVVNSCPAPRGTADSTYPQVQSSRGRESKEIDNIQKREASKTKARKMENAVIENSAFLSFRS